MRQSHVASLLAAAAVGLVFFANPTVGPGQNVELVGQLGGPPRAVCAVGNRAYVGEGLGLTVLDITDPFSPAPLGRITLPNAVEGVCVSGNMAYVADGVAGLYVVDVSNSTSPTIRGFYNTPGCAYDVCTSGTLVYVADSTGGLQIIDVSNPSQPMWRGSCATYDARDVVIALRPVFPSGFKTFVYLADGLGGFKVIDVSNPAAPVLYGSWSLSYPGRVWRVFVSGTQAYLACGDVGLVILGVWDPSSPAYVSTCDTPGYAYDVCVLSRFAYVADGSQGLRIIDVRSPGSPVNCGAYDMTGASDVRGVYPSGGLVYTLDHYRGLEIVDVKNLRGPTFYDAFDTTGTAYGVCEVGAGVAFVADGDKGLQIISCSIPQGRLGYYDTPGDARGVSVVGNRAYVADGNRGLQILDVTKPVVADATRLL